MLNILSFHLHKNLLWHILHNIPSQFYSYPSLINKKQIQPFIIFTQIQNIILIYFHQNLWHILQNISSQFSFIIFIQIQNILSIHFHSYSGRSFTVFLQERIQSHHISSSSILKSKTFFRFIFIHILNDFPSRKKFKRRAKRHVSLLMLVSHDSYLKGHHSIYFPSRNKSEVISVIPTSFVREAFWFRFSIFFLSSTNKIHTIFHQSLFIFCLKKGYKVTTFLHHLYSNPQHRFLHLYSHPSRFSFKK